MPRRYLLAAYVKEEDETPKILSNHTFDVRKKAEDEFLRIANRKVRSTVLYDSQTDEIIKIAIEGEPIFLVKAIELARGVGPNSYLETVKNKVTESAAKNAIKYIAKALLGEAVPGISDVVMAHFTGPYYALKGDHVGVAATAGGLWGTVSGAVIGTIAAGPIGGVVGVIIGGSAASMGAGALVKSFEPPKEHKKCDKCDGTGLFRDFRRCPSCKGYGYKIK